MIPNIPQNVINFHDKNYVHTRKETIIGTDIEFDKAINAPFDKFTLYGDYEQVTPTIESPVYPKFSGNSNLWLSRNMLSSADKTYTNSGVTFVYDKNTSIMTINGTSTREWGNQIAFPFNNLSEFVDGNYTLYGKVIGGSIENTGALRVRFTVNTNSCTDLIFRNTSTVGTETVIARTIPIGFSALHIGLYCLSGLTFNNFQIQLQVVKGTYTVEDIPKWTPYTTPINISDIMYAVPDISGTNYRDYIKVENGIASKCVYTSSEKVFTGAESMLKWATGGYNWSTAGTDTRYRYIAFGVATGLAGISEYSGLCSHFPLVDSNGINYAGYAAYNCFTVRTGTGVGNAAVIKIKYEDLGFTSMPTYEQAQPVFAQWLANKYALNVPVKLRCKKVTPTETDITSTELGQRLLALQTKQDTQYYIWDDGVVPLGKEVTTKILR